MTDLAVRTPVVEFRSAETLGVKYPERILEVLAMPYERPTQRVMHEGHQITEVVSRGAFDGIEHRHRVNVYRDHDKSRGVGKCLSLDPARQEGLVASLYMVRTAMGDETLELAAEGLLDVSVGFRPMSERWSHNRRERRLDKCWLDHIALVGDPAYEDAQVLAVRSAEVEPPTSATPNRDKVLALLAELDIELRR